MNQLLLTCLLLLSGLAAADKVYKWVDENGTTHYSSRPPLIETDTEIIMTPDEPDEKVLIEKKDVTDSTEPTEAKTEPALPEGTSSVPVNPEVVAYCEKLDKNLMVLNSEERIRLKREDGSFEILGNEGKEREKARIMEQKKKYCQ